MPLPFLRSTHRADANTRSAEAAVAADLPFIMFETNTASCGGFPGISDTFASALWAVDYGLQMANSNFTGALLHAGGQNVSYNVRIIVLRMVRSELIPRAIFIAIHW